MSSLFSELKRRNVFRVTAAYAVVAWLIAQIADIGLESFAAPDWVMKTLLLLLIIGLPIAAVLAWAFELTPDGVRRDSDLAAEEKIPGKRGRKLDFIIIGALTIVLAYFVFSTRETPDTEPSLVADKSIAVLPFINIGGGAEDDYLSDGLAETLLHLLAQIDEIQVAARTSAFKFKNTNEDVRVIGQQLGVATVLEGSIQRSGDKIRITAQLINVDDGFHLWSANFDKTINDIFAVQDEIATSVVAALEVTLLGGVRSDQATDPEAYDELLRLRDDVRSADNERIASAIDSLRDLIDRYPDYADAHAELAMAYIIHSSRAGLIPEEFADKALSAAKEAVRISPESAVGHIALANVLTGRGDHVAAGPVIARARELEPGNADVLVDHAAVLMSRREYRQAVEILQRAVRLDPLNTATISALSAAYVAMGAGDEAQTLMLSSLEAAPDNQDLIYAMAQNHQMLGDYESALKGFEKLGAIAPEHIGAWQSPFAAYLDLGDFETAEYYVDRTEALSLNRGADERAQYCFAVGDRECQYAATQRLVATRKGFFVNTWHAKMLLDSGLIAEALAVMKPLREFYDSKGAIYGNLSSRLNLAAIYDLLGDRQSRDESLAAATAIIQHGLDNGWATGEPYYYLAGAEAVRGDLDKAVALLDEASERGFRGTSAFYFDFLWDPYRTDERFRQATDRIMASNAEVLARIRKPGKRFAPN